MNSEKKQGDCHHSCDLEERKTNYRFHDETTHSFLENYNNAKLTIEDNNNENKNNNVISNEPIMGIDNDRKLIKIDDNNNENKNNDVISNESIMGIINEVNSYFSNDNKDGISIKEKIDITPLLAKQQQNDLKKEKVLENNKEELVRKEKINIDLLLQDIKDDFKKQQDSIDDIRMQESLSTLKKRKSPKKINKSHILKRKRDKIKSRDVRNEIKSKTIYKNGFFTKYNRVLSILYRNNTILCYVVRDNNENFKLFTVGNANTLGVPNMDLDFVRHFDLIIIKADSERDYLYLEGELKNSRNRILENNICDFTNVVRINNEILNH
jgi:hypothetical protein